MDRQVKSDLDPLRPEPALIPQLGVHRRGDRLHSYTVLAVVSI
jgi:hypothetical protein